MNEHAAIRPERHYGWLLAYAALVIYGCLVPLEFRAQSFDAALARIHEIPMLALGAYSRADWIANGVLFIPLGFLASNALLGQQPSHAAKAVAVLLATLLSIILAWGIEFVQLYFPPRTVSLNDILAECLGGLFGALLALPAYAFFRKLINSDRYTPSQLRHLTLHALLPLYLCINLFPFDFLVSSAELQSKLASRQWGWLFAGTSLQGSPLRLLLSLCAEVCAASLIGLYVSAWRQQRSGTPVHAALAGLLAGCAIELLQLFMFSGISQGFSILTRALGATVGGFLWLYRDRLDISLLRAQLCRWQVGLWAAWFFVLVLVNGWFWKPWGSMNDAQLSLEGVHWLPFYYYYYTSEKVALMSLLAVCAQYGFVALMVWARQGTAVYAGCLTLCFAVLIEAARLFHPNTHPDPTNVLIATVSSVFLCWLLTLLTSDERAHQNVPSHAPHSSEPNPEPSVEPTPTSGRNQQKPGNRFTLGAALLTAAAVLAWAISFPVPTLPLAVVLLLALVAIWRQPLLYIPITLTALPVFDLAPWSGRLYFDEFDVLILSGGLFAWLRSEAAGKRVADPLYRLFLGTFALSLIISTAISVSHANGIDLNSFSNYLSPFNALRIVRGFAEALFFLAVLRRLGTSSALAPWFAWGMTLGLAIAMAIILMEKRMFGGLFNLASGYRVTGSFSAIHTGGAYIECYLAIACPFLLYLVFHSRKLIVFLGGGLLLLVTTYGLMVTYSRNGYSAYAVALLISFCGLLMSSTGKARKFALVSVLGAAALAIATPVFQGSFAQQRIAEIGKDLGIRTAHWHDALAMRNSNAATTLFGMGIGQYPASHFWQSQEHRTAYPSLLQDDSGNTALQITSGNTIYVEQLVKIEPGRIYQLSFDITQHHLGSSPGVALCEKWMLTSATCATWSTFKPNTVSRHVHYEARLDTKAFSTGSFPARRPIKLSLFNYSKNTLEFDNVKLVDQGHDLLKNGDFSQDMDHWFFASDDHLPWHAKSMPVAILFDQGWFGLMAIVAFTSLALLRGTLKLVAGEQFPTALLAALVAFLVVGIFDTLIDAPRFFFLFTILACLCARREAPSRHG